MSSVSVSFIIPSHNRRDLLKKVLERIRGVSSTVSTEVIVLDNASNDGTIAMVKKEFPQVRLECFTENVGAESRNRGIELARGEYIFMLDDDSYPLPGAVEKGIEILRSDRTIGCIAYRVMLPEKRFWSNGIATVFTGCGALFPTEVLKAIGGYPRGFLFYGEEYDVSYRVWKQGYRVVNPSQLYVFHEKPAAAANEGFAQKLGLLVRNNAYVYSRYLPRKWALRRIEYENWRYKAIANKENVLSGYIEGLMKAVPVVVENFNDDSLRCSYEQIEVTLGLQQAKARFTQFIERVAGQRGVVLHAGKLLPEVIQMVRSFGKEVVAVIDDNKYMQGKAVEGISIHGWNMMSKLNFDFCVCGSSSLVVNDETEQQVSEYPFFRMCEYDM